MTVTCEKRIRRTTSHFLNGTHEFSELILTRMAPTHGSELLSSPAPVGQRADFSFQTGQN